VFSEGEEVFNGEDEVFSFLTLDLTKQRYGWQAHGEKLGGRPLSSTTYSDPGYNSSCGHVNFSMGKQATLPYSDLAMLSGTLDCTNVVEGGSGVIMKWNFIPIF
jgi:hypothetical protein